MTAFHGSQALGELAGFLESDPDVPVLHGIVGFDFGGLAISLGCFERFVLFEKDVAKIVIRFPQVGRKLGSLAIGRFRARQLVQAL
jgi:hypothetical protein